VHGAGFCKEVKVRILSPIDGKPMPLAGISVAKNENHGAAFALRPFGRVLYAPTEGMLEEMWADGFLLLAYGGVRVEVRLKRAGNGAENEPSVHLEALAEAGAPLTAGQVLARVEYLTLPATELQLLIRIEGEGRFRICRVPPLLEGGRTAVLSVTP
jgi:hypothetical protein